MTAPLISAFYAALTGLFYYWLTIRVFGGRRRTGASLGDGGDELLERSIRGQVNAAEQMPIFLIMLVLAEMTGIPSLALHLLGIVFLAGRIMHGLRFNGIGPVFFRVVGMSSSFFASIALGGGLLINCLMQMF